MLILVRHGETAANVAQLLLGRSDPPLTAQGRRQAELLARHLPRPARVVSSPLARARETAGAFGPPVEVDDRWVEMDYGGLDGRPAASVPDDVWQRWRADLHFVPAGGESLAAVGSRVREACGDLAAEAGSSDIVVVSHVSPIKAAVAWALGVGDEVAWRMFLRDAGVCRIATGPPAPTLLSFSEPPGPA